MRPLRRGGGPASGAFDKLLIIALGLGVVLLGQCVPGAAERRMASAVSSPAATATPAPAPAGSAATSTPIAETTSAGTPSPSPTRGADPPYWRVVAPDGVRMRASPGTNTEIIQVLRNGEVVTNLDQRQTVGGLPWQRVALGSTEGWVDAEYLAPQRD
jgi:hypothetical protein